MGMDEAAHLSALTRSNVLLMAPDEALGAYTGRGEAAMGLFGLLAEQPSPKRFVSSSWEEIATYS